MIRITLIVAIVAGLAVAALNFTLVRQKVTTLQSNLAEQTAGRQKAETELAGTRKDLKSTKDKLTQTEQTLATTTEERDKAVQDATTLKKKSDQLTEDLTKTKGERDAAQEEVARYHATGMTPDQIVQVNKQIKNLQDTLAGTESENKVLGTKIHRLETELDRYRSPDKPVMLPASLKGSILVADPKWNFVVLNIGENQGVLEHGELLVNRNGRLVAKVVVSSVQKDRCVANVMPGWQLSEVLEGDQVIPAHPAS